MISTVMYYYLHYKAKISLKYLLTDNVAVILVAAVIGYGIWTLLPNEFSWITFIISPPVVVGLGLGLTMIRFWRTPKRKITATENQIVSPADGNIIYVKKLDSDQVPISVKNGKISRLDELTKTNLVKQPCWLIGINMTPFDVHKNCAPISGKLTFNKHTDGKFLSLKAIESETENERNTIVIENGKIKVGVVQIASKMVRRIDSYVNVGDQLKKGQWFGMIRFGSQVDVILPIECKVNVELKQQVYAGKTIIAEI